MMTIWFHEKNRAITWTGINYLWIQAPGMLWQTVPINKHHDEAVKTYPKLLSNYHHLKTTNLVIAETYILIRRSIGHQPAIKFLESIAASPRVIKIYSDSIFGETAENILRQYKDQDFSYTDAVSFVVMKQYGITQAFCFDKHFFTAGFTIIP